MKLKSRHVGAGGIMSKFTSFSPGYTLTEVLIVVAILGGVLVVFGSNIIRGFSSALRLNHQADAVMDIQQAMIFIEMDLESLTRIDVCNPRELIFQLDSNHLPGFNLGEDLDRDGVVNNLDIDDDGDMTGPTGLPVAGTNFNGNDLWDQDDDNNGFIDVHCRYFVDNGNLVRDFNYNGGGWGLNQRVILRGISGDIFEFYGSLNHTPGPDADRNGDGIITRIEIDSFPIGNGNGLIDSNLELNYVDSIAVMLNQDRNGDGIPEFRLNLRTRPPLLSSNRRVL